MITAIALQLMKPGVWAKSREDTKNIGETWFIGRLADRAATQKPGFRAKSREDTKNIGETRFLGRLADRLQLRNRVSGQNLVRIRKISEKPGFLD